jgi:pyruvate carboxylase subunit B
MIIVKAKGVGERADSPSQPFHLGHEPMSHLKAIEAGVDIIDTCMSPYAYRTSTRRSSRW